MRCTRRRGLRPVLAAALCLVALVSDAAVCAARELVVRTTFKGAFVPGVTVIATHDAARIVTTTDEDGAARLATDSGAWRVRVEMLGFEPVTRDVTIDAAVAADVTLEFELAIVSSDAPLVMPTRATSDPAASAVVPAPADDTPIPADTATTTGSLVVTGSTHNAAASPFAQPPAFGNNRPRASSLYTGTLLLAGGSAAWDARPFSFVSQPLTRPDYADVQLSGGISGPLRVPFVRRFRPMMNVGYQRSVTTSANGVTTRVPTLLERTGDFAASQAAGQPLDPSTGAPFAGGVIPAGRLSPQALALLAYYPAPTRGAASATNYDAAVTERTTRDAVQLRLNQSLTRQQSLSGGVSYQRSRTASTSLLQFLDRRKSADVDLSATWMFRMSQTRSMRVQAQLLGSSVAAEPFFANRIDVSGEAGIAGNDRAPASWGPPNLDFANGVLGLAAAPPASQRTRTRVAGADGQWLRGHHNVTFGGDWRARRIDSTSDANPRGTFTFTGAATGDAFADFLLGLPQASTIAFGDRRVLTGTLASAFVADDWHIAPPLTLNLGVRWEYEGPLREQAGQLANLDLAPDFSVARVVTSDASLGAVTGRAYGPSLIRPDWRTIQPRLAVAWRPFAATSLLVRGGYGLYRQTDVYLPIAIWLARQPPFSTVATLESTAQRPLTMANGFAAAPDALSNTVAVDPDLRAPFAENWQVLVQRDLPVSLTVIATYLGTRGHHLLQESLPNTMPPGAANSCPTCPSGFVYVSSSGTSLRHAAQVQIRRRLRSGFTASMQYTLAKATDNATAMNGVSAAGTSIAQDWRDLDAERGPSSFDQRHQLRADVEYTTGVGVGGGGLLTGSRGALTRGWVLAGQLTAGSGLPITPRYLTSVPGTGITGTIRADVVDDRSTRPSGYFLDPARYAPPAAGGWGTAGRNSARGPAQFSFDASLGRSFSTGDRRTLEWRLDATNILNRVTYATVDTLVGSPQFGLPTRANTMRRVRMTLRWRF